MGIDSSNSFFRNFRRRRFFRFAVSFLSTSTSTSLIPARHFSSFSPPPHTHSAQSSKFGTKIYSETVTKVDLSRRPFRVSSADGREVLAETVVVATGAVAKRLDFPGSGEGEGGFWNKGVSACAVCDGAAPMFRGKPLAVVGGGDTAMEEALFLTKYGSKVYIIHRRDELRASKVMQRRALEHPKVEMVWSSACVEACGAEGGTSKLGSIKVKNLKTEAITELECSGLFFAIGHEPASKFLDGQLELDADGYIVTKPGTVDTSVPGVFACGDVQDKKWRQAITAAGTGCMAALSAEHFLVEHGSAGEAEQAAEELARGAQVASPNGSAAAAAAAAASPKKKVAAEEVRERAVPSVAGKERVPA
jgi:thioredoxin reductase (NADPH)